ncbi:hypothetical protein, partial [Coxiella burnetii]
VFPYFASLIRATLLLKKQQDSNRGFNIFLSFIH